jgi:ribosome-associated protein
VIDAFDVMIHLFLAEKRELYGLERLWRDAVEVRPSVYLPGAKKPVAAKKTATEKKPRQIVAKKSSLKRKKKAE